MENHQNWRVFYGKIIKLTGEHWCISMVSIDVHFSSFPYGFSPPFHGFGSGQDLLEVPSVRRPQQGRPGLGVALGAHGQAESAQAAGAMLHVVAEVEHLGTAGDGRERSPRSPVVKMRKPLGDLWGSMDLMMWEK